ncbi:MAG: type II secretion system protein [Patescibacteria group bacterium]|nr:type II secretion system protein [Patescibacteria group bacterium]
MRRKQKAFTLIEVLVACFLISIVFIGIVGGFRLAIKVVAQSKAKMGAVYLASQSIEELRNLSFSNIETSEDTIILNGVSYNIQTLVEDFDDCADGTISGFDCGGLIVAPDVAPNDYKKIKVRILWADFFGGETVLSTNIASDGLETGEGKGALRIALSNSSGQPIEIQTGDQLPPCPDDTIRIINQTLGIDQCYGTDLQSIGTRLLILDASESSNDYKIIVEKQGYGIDQTFKSGEEYNGSIIVAPTRNNPTIREGEVYPITFIMDESSDLTVSTSLSWGGGSFLDTFLNQDKISEINNLTIADGKATLAASSPVTYFPSGDLVSDAIIPAGITQWYELEWSDFEELQTDINYQLFYSTSSDWHLIPNSNLPGNENGFDSSPIDLSSLDVLEFPNLKIKTSFSTNNLEKTPTLYDWQLSWKNGSATPIASVNFDLRGDKIVGTDASEELIYKYDGNYSSNLSGEKEFLEMETDNYYFSDFNKDDQSLNLNQGLSPMPYNLSSGTTTAVVLYLESDNSLLVKVQDASSTDPIFGAMVSLSNSPLEYEEANSTNMEGEALFIPLDSNPNYSLNIEADNYYNKSYSFGITGEDYKTVGLERYE